jgi:protein pelota
MKLLKKQISHKDGSGLVLLRPETDEDLWHAYNLLQVNDLVRCTTVRKVVKESSGGTGSTNSVKRRMMLTISVLKVDFDVDVLQLRLSGTVTSENDNGVRLGAHHTLTLELHQNFSIEKTCWDQVFLDRIHEACHPELQAEIAAVVLQGSGLCHVCLVTGALTITKARIDVNIPKKRTGSSAHAKAVTKFYQAVYQAILNHVDFQKVKVVLLASPGFVKDDLYQYILTESVRREDRAFIENKSKFILCQASSGHKHALEEVFSNPDVMNQMTDTKVAKEVQVLNKFMRLMDSDPDRAYYGYDHVKRAHEHLAIDSLLVTDELFRSSNVQQRKQYVQLVESVRQNGGQVFVLSSMHVSGQQLQQVSGVAAILRYPMPDLDDDGDENGEDDNDEEAVPLGGGGHHANDYDKDDDEDYDPNRRLKEDLADMGLGL